MVTAVAYTNFRNHICAALNRELMGMLSVLADLGQEDTRTHQRVDARYDMFPVRGYGQV